MRVARFTAHLSYHLLERPLGSSWPRDSLAPCHAQAAERGGESGGGHGEGNRGTRVYSGQTVALFMI